MLNAVTGPIEVDTLAFDTFAATGGTLVASSNSGAALTYGISGGIAGSTIRDGLTYDVSKTDPYGTLFVNSTTGAYVFVPDSNAINALTSPTTTNFTVTVSDGTLSTGQTFTIAINGTNDAAIISGATAGSAVEAGDGVAGAPAAPTAPAARQHRRRQSAQYLHGNHLADRELGRLRQLHHDDGRRVDLHAQ